MPKSCRSCGSNRGRIIIEPPVVSNVADESERYVVKPSNPQYEHNWMNQFLKSLTGKNGCLDKHSVDELIQSYNESSDPNTKRICKAIMESMNTKLKNWDTHSIVVGAQLQATHDIEVNNYGYSELPGINLCLFTLEETEETKPFIAFPVPLVGSRADHTPTCMGEARCCFTQLKGPCPYPAKVDECPTWISDIQNTLSRADVE